MHDEYSDLSYLKNNHLTGQGPSVGSGVHQGKVHESGQFTGTMGPASQAASLFGEYDFSDHELDDTRRIDPEEAKHVGDARFEQDLDFFPTSFKEAEEALDEYNTLGFRFKL